MYFMPTLCLQATEHAKEIIDGLKEEQFVVAVMEAESNSKASRTVAANHIQNSYLKGAILY